jgi:hypothetical protein
MPDARERHAREGIAEAGWQLRNATYIRAHALGRPLRFGATALGSGPMFREAKTKAKVEARPLAFVVLSRVHNALGEVARW